jgi:hypothetical protein
MSFQDDELITSNIRPPIPLRDYDWCAFRHGYEPGDTIGYGETEEAAINDFYEQAIGERDE